MKELIRVRVKYASRQQCCKTHKRTFTNLTPIMTITFYNWTVLPPPFSQECMSASYSFSTKGDNQLLPWPPRSPDLTPGDFFLWGFVKDSVYVPPLPMSLKELRDLITHALQTITADRLHRVWDEFDYRVDVCRVTQGAQIEGL